MRHRPSVIFQSTSIWDTPSETVALGRNVALESIARHDTVIKEVPIDMTTVNVDSILAMVPLLEKKAQEKLVLDIVFKHDLGCTCSMCESLRTRYPMASTENADIFEKEGGCHQTPNFGATNTSALQSIARSLEVVAGGICSIRDLIRGRDKDGEKINSTIAAIASFLIGGPRPVQSTAPSTQRAPNFQQAPAAQPVQATQANLYAAAKRVATDQEMAQFKKELTVRLNPNDWKGASHKGRKLIECEPDFLDMYADMVESFAIKAKPKVADNTANDYEKRDAQWGEKNAAQYRRLAQEIRSGRIQQAPVATQPVYAGDASGLI